MNLLTRSLPLGSAQVSVLLPTWDTSDHLRQASSILLNDISLCCRPLSLSLSLFSSLPFLPFFLLFSLQHAIATQTQPSCHFINIQCVYLRQHRALSLHRKPVTTAVASACPEPRQTPALLSFTYKPPSPAKTTHIF
ncbi:hypothetical protein BDU57DRAFT_149001 [Ampelomyces quisqualis]|uniref:Uncharacterized protein n=1 Tax=Ampelomyces quisqualis TaxID=50730 RepID=A0A6A5QV40_AMPQU|nr:hypothetical protein BDU57DRAFT_149001 [Ampelomyces quisqualis]